MQLVRHCKGSPIAIKVIGRSLSNRSIELWQKMVEELSQGHSILDSDSELLTSLQKILDVLEDNPIIKECFMDLALFPEHQTIPVAALIDMWVELYGLDNYGIKAIAIVNRLDSMNLANVLVTRYSHYDYLHFFSTASDGFLYCLYCEGNFLCKELMSANFSGKIQVTRTVITITTISSSCMIF